MTVLQKNFQHNTSPNKILECSTPLEQHKSSSLIAKVIIIKLLAKTNSRLGNSNGQ